MFLDVQTGKLQGTKEWSVPRPRGGIIPVGEGKFVVVTPAMIALYAPSLELLKDFNLSTEQQSHLWNFYSSPSGKSILMEYHYPEASFQWIDTSSLQPQSAWKDRLPRLSISDNDLAISRETYSKSHGFLAEVFVRPRNGVERTVCRQLVGKGDGCGIPQFLSNDLLALWAPHEFRVVTDGGGDSPLKATVSKDEWLGRPFYPSADGKRFATTIWAHKGGSEFFDVSYQGMLKRIVVYDMSSHQKVYTLDVGKKKIKDLSGLALSPDGSLIAILLNGVVETYKISLP